ncbi:hypothetical protein HZB00_00990 [Candidatus Woesearchaeota archaeon]|nr:hypothetical protein [Candidatus Woesearchaeota archaeon]
MQKFKNILFWSEFPEKVDWKQFKRNLSFPVEVYVACETKREFFIWKKKIESKTIKVGAWPILPKIEGYWFSGYCSKESIDKLLEFQGLPVKVDVEPPMPKIDYSFLNLCKYGLNLWFKKAKNNNYLHKIVHQLEETSDVIMSGIPLPKILRKKYGDDVKIKPTTRRNFFIYTTLHPKILDPFFRWYYRRFIQKNKRRYKENFYCALGCLGPGIFGNELIYSSINEFEKDIQFMLNNGVENLVVFEAAGIMKRKNPQAWFNLIKKYS